MANGDESLLWEAIQATSLLITFLPPLHIFPIAFRLPVLYACAAPCTHSCWPLLGYGGLQQRDEHHLQKGHGGDREKDTHISTEGNKKKSPAVV